MYLFGISHYDLVFIMAALMYGYFITSRKK
ncbi:hypothetical protein FLACHUCJ7_01312 [Flavobacterium chungangense]|uniref:Uncharacterized protein n=2 Tax=Flavobacterium TaxID=237 RepID=A0A6V6YUF3_9FLAO|nr:hypothetical protein FLACHUCJ7_01312 [Flavobacterium chungangense]CAD0004382.1 hypothetical protein FLAT13_02233 [Flavobacterium salmonis]